MFLSEISVSATLSICQPKIYVLMEFAANFFLFLIGHFFLSRPHLIKQAVQW